MADDLGQIIGTGLGLGASALTAGAIPPSLGMSLGGALGEEVQGLFTKKAPLPPLTDPNQQAQVANYQNIISELKNRKKALDTGSMYKPEQEEIKQQGQAALNSVSKFSGGNVGAAVSAMNVAQRATGRNLGKLYSNMSKESGDVTMEGLKVNEMMSSLIDTMAQRRLNIQMYQQQQADSDKRRLEQQGLQGILGGLAGSSGKFDSWFKGLFTDTTGNNMKISPSQIGGTGGGLNLNTQNTNDTLDTWQPPIPIGQ